MSKFGRPVGSSHQHNFAQIPSVEIQRSVFDRSSTHKTAFDAGYLVPVFLDEALPGDTFHLKTSILARLSTPIVPFMDNLKMEIQFFSVPYRLLWDHWQAFNGEQKKPGASTDYLIPQMSIDAPGLAVGSLGDYFGLPTGVEQLSVSALPFRAYNLIYNEWYRDENLCDPAEVPTGDASENWSQVKEKYKLRKRAKRHDYFTSCLPWPQKGPGVELPINTPNISYDRPPVLNFGSFEGKIQATGINYNTQEHFNRYFPLTALNVNHKLTSEQTVDAVGWKDLGISISANSAVTINQLRQAFQLQRLMERDARGGTRYIEIIRSHFGVVSPDARVQRPEYLGQASFDININPVLQNSATTGTSPQGNLAAFGFSSGVSNGFSHSFVEHCLVIGIASVRSDLTYQQGINRMWSRRTRYDFYWPALSHLGEQAVLNKEIYAQGARSDDIDEKVFGYQERYAEYRYKPSQITGKLRSTYSQSLDVWHLAQKFNSLPKLNREFIEENPPMQRVLAVQNEPQFIADMLFNLRCVRPMPVYSVPGLIDHF